MNCTLNRIYVNLSTFKMLHIAMNRGMNYVSHTCANLETNSGRTYSVGASYHFMSIMIYINHGHKLVLWILDMTLFCLLLLVLLQTGAKFKLLLLLCFRCIIKPKSKLLFPFS